MHRLHSGLTVAVAVKAGKTAELRAVLKSLNNASRTDETRTSASDPVTDPVTGPACDFAKSETTLVVSGVILPSQNYHGETLPETLIFATTYTGPLSSHLIDLVKSSKTGLQQIFSHCVGFNGAGTVNDKDIISFIRSHRRPGAFGSRYSCITKQDIKKEKELRQEIEEYLDSAELTAVKADKKALEIKMLIQRHIKSKGEKFEWATKPTKDSILELSSKNKGYILVSLLALAIIITTVIVGSKTLGWLLSLILGIAIVIDLVLVILLIVFLLLYFISRSKNITAARPPDDYVRQVTATQLRPVINEMTAAAPLKKGTLRRIFYSSALSVINLHSWYLMKVPTVSSLRWLSIDKKKRLVFLSNYSNTTDFYVREFLNGKTPRGVNFMFTNGEGFPDAKLLFKGGITTDPEGYMNVIHTHQHPTDLWYIHDYDLTIDQILRNRKIRNGLFKEMNEEEAARWLKLL
ncbi:hypothetical protein ACX0G7_17965 [Flavitalea antarctica]